MPQDKRSARSDGAIPEPVSGPDLGNYGNNVAVPGQRAFSDAFDLQRALWVVSELEGVRKCGRVPFGSFVDVYERRDGSVSFGGLCRCHSVWACPVCAPAIRRRRAGELSEALCAHLAMGGGALFVTSTLPHDQGDRLAAIFAAVANGWRAVGADWSVRELRNGLPWEFVRAAEVTFGANGWHPHLHVCLLFERPISREEAQELRSVIFSAWCSSVERSGYRPPSPSYGVSAIRVGATDEDGHRVGEYVSKVEGLADELVRLDSKEARKGLSPFGLLREVVRDEERWLPVWREYERGTKGRRALTWSRGARELLRLGGELSDEELSDPAGDPLSVRIGVLEAHQWRLIVEHPNGHRVFLDALSGSTQEAVTAALEAVRGSMPWWCTQAGWEAEGRRLEAERRAHFVGDQLELEEVG